MSTRTHAERVRGAAMSLPETAPATIGRRRNVHTGPPRSHEDVGFAPVKPEDRVCRSRAGRWRAAHAYDADGTCLFCCRRMIL